MRMEKSWLEKLNAEFDKPYIKNLKAFLSEELKKNHVIYPPEEQIFEAFCHAAFDDIKVVIVGQDPYHNPNQAHGLSFSVTKEVKSPPSLQNIYKELHDDLGIPIPSHGFLQSWAKQGVLLLNATLTVRANEPKSHYGKGWERFTDTVIEKLSEKQDPIVFLLWGKSAQEKCENVPSLQGNTPHLILKAAHPSPYSASNGFFGCKHFSKANAFLQKHGKSPVDWNIE